jgi:ABC-type lipoprotein release transport system permease subunit
VPVKISAGGHTEDMPYVSEAPFAMHHLTNETGTDPVVGDGVVLPRYYADRLHINKGDEVRVYMPSTLIDGTVKVTDITDQMMNFVIVTTFATAQEHLGLTSPIYNTVYATARGDVSAAVKNIKDQPEVLSTSSLADDRRSIERVISLFNTYVIVLIFLAIILESHVFNISITLIARRYEFILTSDGLRSWRYHQSLQ